MSSQQPQLPYPPNFGNSGPNVEMRSQYGGPRSVQIPGIPSPSQPNIRSPVPGMPVQFNPGEASTPLQHPIQQQGGQMATNPMQGPSSQNIGSNSPSQTSQSGAMQPLSMPCRSDGNFSGGNVPGGSQLPQQAPQNQIVATFFCRLGQEVVQESCMKLQDFLQICKSVQPPNGTIGSANMSKDKLQKLRDHLSGMMYIIKKVKMIYDKCNESSQTQGMEYMHIEGLIPFKDEWDAKSEERKTSESYRVVYEELKELIDKVIAKNMELKEIIDNLRRIAWETNTMLKMRRS